MDKFRSKILDAHWLNEVTYYMSWFYLFARYKCKKFGVLKNAFSFCRLLSSILVNGSKIESFNQSKIEKMFILDFRIVFSRIFNIGKLLSIFEGWKPSKKQTIFKRSILTPWKNNLLSFDGHDFFGSTSDSKIEG